MHFRFAALFHSSVRSAPGAQPPFPLLSSPPGWPTKRQASVHRSTLLFLALMADKIHIATHRMHSYNTHYVTICREKGLLLREQSAGECAILSQCPFHSPPTSSCCPHPHSVYCITSRLVPHAPCSNLSPATSQFADKSASLRYSAIASSCSHAHRVTLPVLAGACMSGCSNSLLQDAPHTRMPDQTCTCSQTWVHWNTPSTAWRAVWSCQRRLRPGE